MHQMVKSGQDLRATRKTLGVSQARLSEITHIDQHHISAFELGKIELAPRHLQLLNHAIHNIHRYAKVVDRRKRYRNHTYDRLPDRSRAELCVTSPGNSSYLSVLSDLSNYPKNSFSGISLFSGIGGLSKGFKRAGCDIKGFVEINDALSLIYERNFPDSHRLARDIKVLDTRTLEGFIQSNGPIDCIIGGPPCQGFSLSGKRDITDPRNYLFEDYLRVIDVIRPKVAIMENVRLLTSMRSKSGSFVKDDIVDGFKAHGYQARLYEVNTKSYGVPQHRERVVFVATRNDTNKCPTFPSPTFGESRAAFEDAQQIRTFADACSDLPFLESGETSADPLHCAVAHPDHVIQWLWHVRQGFSAHDNEDLELRPPSGYNTTYKRQVWLEPAATVQTTFGMISGCRNVHPIATRALTVREAARLQSFPDDFEFTGPLGAIRTGIGNAVPPLLAKVVAEHVVSHILDLVEVPRL